MKKEDYKPQGELREVTIYGRHTQHLTSTLNTENTISESKLPSWIKPGNSPTSPDYFLTIQKQRDGAWVLFYSYIRNDNSIIIYNGVEISSLDFNKACNKMAKYLIENDLFTKGTE